jgi:hypothetical protein
MLKHITRQRCVVSGPSFRMGTWTPRPCSSALPVCHPPPPLRHEASVPCAAAGHGDATLGQAALEGHGHGGAAAVQVAALVGVATVSGHAAACHTVVGPQLVPRRRRDLALARLMRAIVPCDREQLVAPRAAPRGDGAVRQRRSMAAARANEVRVWHASTSGVDHSPLARRRAAQLEQRAGQLDGASANPKLRFLWRKRHNGVPGAPSQPAARGRMQPSPFPDTHLLLTP